MLAVAFGTYDVSRHPRVRVLIEGLLAHGFAVQEINRPLSLSTAQRVEILERPWLLYRLVGRLVLNWLLLTWRRARLRERPDVVVVGYLGQFDVLLARMLFPRTPLVLDLLVMGADTARDRGVAQRGRQRLLAVLDRLACAVSDHIVVDTEEHRLLLGRAMSKGIVVPVGAPEEWFAASRHRAPAATPLRVVFYGLFTPLQGASVIAEAIRLVPQRLSIAFTMVGNGQDKEQVAAVLADDARVTWVAWVDSAELPRLVATHDVCLGIFGVGPKAMRVVPNKVYQGAAAGCALITSDTPPQRRALGEAALFVAPGDREALAAVLVRLASDPSAVRTLQELAATRADSEFRAAIVVRPLVAAVVGASGELVGRDRRR